MPDKSPSVLVLEDQPLVALDIEDILAGAGFDDITIITSCADAETWLNTHHPDLAVIDIHLRDGVCINAAKMLVESKIPFVVHSALSSYSYDDGSVFSHGIWISKPVIPDRLISAARGALA